MHSRSVCGVNGRVDVESSWGTCAPLAVHVNREGSQILESSDERECMTASPGLTRSSWNLRTTDWFGLRETLKLTQFQPLSLGKDVFR